MNKSEKFLDYVETNSNEDFAGDKKAFVKKIGLKPDGVISSIGLTDVDFTGIVTPAIMKKLMADKSFMGLVPGTKTAMAAQFDSGE